MTSYQPDLTWDEEVVGYKKHMLHWMFRRALQALLMKRLSHIEYREACNVLRRYLLAPDFGFSEKKPDLKDYRQMINLDPCDCTTPEPEQMEESVQSEEIQIGEGSNYQI
ncbi:uncharacterized protein LOC125233577 [Leguminivora glycinivorella]|uniref:uncharacterized protein LOC125233577 n=1 Tax=Leguminivora glycinivorella TaxID=1035111 RepID=UPI00200C4816|nr:uncharacterized protein LOC125233577 [Leguminivora glycinivorella]